MRAAVVATAVACAFVSQASAKGPLVLCGPQACGAVGSEPAASVRWLPEAFESRAAPVGPVPFFKLRWSVHQTSVLAYWLPSAGVLRLAPQSDRGVWVRPSEEEAALLRTASAELRPYAAPRRVAVTVGLRPVPPGGSTYLRLHTIGRPVAKAVGARGWIPIDMWRPAETPWTDCQCLWVSRAGAFLKRSDGRVIRIPAPVAVRVRNRLPLSSWPPSPE